MWDNRLTNNDKSSLSELKNLVLYGQITLSFLCQSHACFLSMLQKLKMLNWVRFATSMVILSVLWSCKIVMLPILESFAELISQLEADKYVTEQCLCKMQIKLTEIGLFKDDQSKCLFAVCSCNNNNLTSSCLVEMIYNLLQKTNS